MAQRAAVSPQVKAQIAQPFFQTLKSFDHTARLFQRLALHKSKNMLPVLVVLPVGVLPFGSLHNNAAGRVGKLFFNFTNAERAVNQGLSQSAYGV